MPTLTNDCDHENLMVILRQIVLSQSESTPELTSVAWSLRNGDYWKKIYALLGRGKGGQDAGRHPAKVNNPEKACQEL